MICKWIPTLAAALLPLQTFAAAEIIKDRATMKVLTPSLAERKIEKIRLDNGLEALLVSDPQTTQSGALLAVRTGSWEDPENYPGLAHFLEHMLFMGTKQYPEEKGYQRYISDHGGITNAFTTSSYTAYLFSVDNNGFKGALDRFSSFFKDPLFNPSGVSRELEAVDQEFSKNSENDDYREYLVYKELLDPAHPNSRFSSGNHKTLDKTSRETLIKWYREHYSANLMSLVVVSPQPLNELKLLVDEMFSAVPNSGKELFSADAPYTPSSAKRKIVYVEPLKDVKTLTLVWELSPPLSLMEESKPGELICHVLGHEGEESLLAELKREKLAEKLSCGAGTIGQNKQELQITVGLTDKGLNNVDEVIARLFQTLKMIKNEGIPPYLFEEISKIHKFNYSYKARENLFEELMEHGFQITEESIETYPERTKTITRYDPAAVDALLNELTPANAVIMVKAPRKQLNRELDRKEQWLGTAYTIEQISDERMQSWENADPNPHITLPQPNPFIPEKLSVEEGEHASRITVPKPEKLYNKENGIYYYAPDKQFGVPRAYLHFTIRTPLVDAGDAEKSALADLYLKGLEESLKSYSYSAQMAGLNYKLEQEKNGISIKVDGYSDKALLLLEKILDTAANWKTPSGNFTLYKEALKRRYQNFSLETPLQQASEMLSKSIHLHYSTNQAKAAALKQITLQKLNNYSAELFRKNYVQALIYGNIDKIAAEKAIASTQRILGTVPYLKHEQIKREVINLPKDEGPFFIQGYGKTQGNAALLAIEILPYSLKARAVQHILSQAMSSPFFHELRTRQQTGYIVQETAQDLEKHLFSLFAVQSSSHSPRDLLARFELFIEQFLREIENEELPEARFNEIKGALIQELKNPAQNLSSMGKLLSVLAFEYHGDFDWISKRVAATEELGYSEFIALARQYLGKQNRRRLAILFDGIADGWLDYKQVRNPQSLKSLSTFSGG